MTVRRRQLLAVAALAALTLGSGCLGGVFGGGSVSNDRLGERSACGDYRWNASADVHVTVTENGEFCAVQRIRSDSTELFTRDGFGGREPLDVSAVRYRYPNGTVVDGVELRERGGSIERTDETVQVTLPDGTTGGQLGYNGPSSPKRFSLPTFADGASYEVVLPPHRRIDFFLFGNVNPPGYSSTIDDRGRTHVLWNEVTANSIAIRFYHQRDLTIFAAIVGALSVVAVGGVIYYQRQIRRLRRRREESDIDVDVDDEFDDGPPPGMR